MRTLFYKVLLLYLILGLPTAPAGSNPARQGQNRMVLESPITVRTERGHLVIIDANNSVAMVSGPPFVTIKTEMDARIYIPLIVAIVTLLSSVYLSWRNHIQMKKQKWYDLWSQQILSIYDKLFSLAVGAIFDPSSYTNSQIEAEIGRIKIHLSVHFPNNLTLIATLNDLEKKITKDSAYQERNAVFDNLRVIANVLVENVKNG